MTITTNDTNESEVEVPVCKRFLRQRCTFGDTCKFRHPQELTYEKREVDQVEDDSKQCSWIIHNQRRCKMLALIDEDGLCHYHRNEGGDSIIAGPNRRISSSHKRMRNPGRRFNRHFWDVIYHTCFLS